MVRSRHRHKCGDVDVPFQSLTSDLTWSPVQSLASVLVASGILQCAAGCALGQSLSKLSPPGDTVCASQVLPSWRCDWVMAAAVAGSDTSRRPKAVQYSDNYYKRLAVHRYASYAMLPLFAAEYALGQSLYNRLGTADTVPTSRSLRSWHGIVADAIGVLFVVNTYTGFLNLEESSVTRKGRARREVHAALMVLSELGFVATGQLVPGRGGVDASRRNAHRTVAMLAISTAVVGDALMLIWNH
jgi:hypothetical protein